MKKIIAFAGTNSKNSINKQLAKYAASQLKNVEVEVLDLNNYELPLYGIDYELANGIPDNAQAFFDKLQSANGIVLSLAEHNGAYATVFKNLFDWLSRIEGNFWNNIPMFLLATSPGPRGGKTVLEIAKGRFPFHAGNIVADFSLPSFSENFTEDGIADKELKNNFFEAVESLQNAI